MSFRRSRLGEQNEVQADYNHDDKKNVQGCKNSHIFAVVYNCSPTFLSEPGSPLIRMLLASERHVAARNNPVEINLVRHGLLEDADQLRV